VRKWRAVVELFKSQGSETAITAIEDIRREALERRHWETLRSIDLYRAVVLKDVQLFWRVYFSSPYEEFRKRMLSLWGSELSVPAQFCLSFGAESPAPKRRFDLLAGEESNGKATLKVGQAQHRLFTLLVQDGYRPVSVGTIFHKIFPDEYFDASTSSNRVHHVVLRLRHWFEENQIPLKVEEESGSYRLEGVGEYEILLGVSQPQSATESRLATLRGEFGNKPFTANEASEFLKVSLSSVKRILRAAVESDEVEKQGAGKNTSYCFRA
jgi:hypothetical protein